MYPEGVTDILISTGDNAYTFTVDVDADPPYVTAALPANNPNMYLSSEAGGYIFDQRDNITILEIGVRLPYCFCLVNGCADLIFNWQVTPNGALSDMDRIGIAGAIWIPKPDSGLLDAYQPFAPNANDQHIAYAFAAAPTVSMIGVPAILDGDEYDINVWMKIKHTLDLGS